MRPSPTWERGAAGNILEGRVLSSRVLRLLLPAVLLASAACRDRLPDAPVLRGVHPDRGPEGSSVHVVISADRLAPELFADFGAPAQSRLEGRYRARLGNRWLREVTLRADGSLSAVVPEDLGPGVWALTVTRADGLELTLESAYRVVSVSRLNELVTGFRFAPLPPTQQAFTPFSVSIEAVDGTGAVVTAYSGDTSLEDLTGTVVPRTVTFSLGRWSGQVEVRATHPADALSAKSAAGAGSSTPFAVLPRPPAALRFSTPSQTVQAGACSARVELSLLDDLGQGAAAPAALSLQWTVSPASGVELFSDAACSSPLSSATLPAGASALPFHFRATAAGPLALTVESAPLRPASQAHAVVPGPASRLTFLTPPQILSAGACSTRAVVAAQDAFGNATSLAGTGAVALAPMAGLTAFGDAACAAPATAVSFDSAGEASLYFQGSTAGSYEVTVSQGALAPAQQGLLVRDMGFATKLAFVTASQVLAAGECSALVGVQTQDSFGNAITGPAAVPLQLSSSPAGLTAHEDAACAGPAVTSVTLAAGNSTRTFYVRGVRSGSYALTAASSGLLPASQTQTISGAGASQLAFTSPPRTVAAGSCSAELTVELRDAFDNPVASGPAAVSLAASGVPVTLYADAACATQATSVPLNGGRARFFLRGTRAGAVTADVSAPGVSGASQAQTVTHAAPAQLAFTSAPQTVAAGACSAALRLEVQDAYGNASPVGSATTAALAASPAAGFAFFLDAGCTSAAGSATVPAAASAATVFFRGTASGPVTVTASSGGLGTATQGETVSAAAASTFAFATPPRTAVAGACSAALTVQTRDGLGNPSAPGAPLSADLAAAPATGLSFYSDAACAQPLATLDFAAGVSTATLYFRSTRAGTPVLTVSATGYAAGTQQQTVTPAAAVRLAFSTAPQTLTAGACSQVATVQLEDTYGNAAPSPAAATVALAASPAAGFAFYADAACATQLTGRALAAGSSAVSFHFKGTVAGSPLLTASTAGASDATQTATVTAASAPAQLAFTTAPRTASAGACSAVLTVQAQDSFGNATPVGASTQVSLAANPATGVGFFSDPTCSTSATAFSIPGGSSTGSFYFRGTLAGSFSADVSSPGLTSASQTQAVVPGAPAQLAFSSAPLTTPAGACAGPVTLALQDASGNASAAASDLSVALVGPGGVTFYAAAGCGAAVSSVTVAMGSASAAFWFRATAAGATPLDASASGVSGASQTQTVIPAAPTALAFTTAAQSQAAGSCSAVTSVQTRDAYGNPSPVSANTVVSLTAAPAGGFTFYSDATCTTASSAPTLAAGGANLTFYWRATAAGGVSVTAAAAGLSSAQQAQTVRPGAPTALAFTTPPRALVAGGCSAVLTVEARDAYGNVAPVSADTALALSASPAAGAAFFLDAACATGSGTATLASGSATASFYFSGTTAGGVALTASGSVGSASQAATVSPGPAVALRFGALGTLQPQGVPVAVTLTAEDAFGNVATSFTGAAALALGPAGTVACTTACGGTAVTAAFTAGVWSGSVTFGPPPGTGRTLTATSGALTGTSDPFDVVAPTASPPVAAFTYNPAVIIVGGSISVDASSSSDRETATANLVVSWDRTGAAAGAPPWTAWTATKTASFTYNTAGTYSLRLAVRDTDGQLAYTARTVVVLPLLSGDRCVVDTSSMADDGAFSCGLKGADGKLSLAEAVRLSNASFGRQVITFDGPRTIVSSATLTFTSDADLVAPSGVILDSLHLVYNGGDHTLRGVEFTNTSRAVDLKSGSLTMSDVYLHDFHDVALRGTATLLRTRISRCEGDCVAFDGALGSTLTIRQGEFSASPTHKALVATNCQGTADVDVATTLFVNVKDGVNIKCPGSRIINNTFHANENGIDYNSSGSSHVLRNNVFTQSIKKAVERCGTFLQRDYHQLYLNAADGCVAGDPNTLTSSTLYIFQAGADFRLQATSPALDSAVDTGLDVNDTGPGRFFGGGVDRGGRETF